MSYFNKDRYLRLKQTLVFLQVTRLGAIVKGNDDISGQEIVNTLNVLIERIKDDVTYPEGNLEGMIVPLDIDDAWSAIFAMVKDPENFLPKCSKIEQIEKLIFEYPVKRPLEDSVRENISNKQFWPISMVRVDDLKNMFRDAASTISYFGTRDTDIGLPKVLALVNLLETMEWIFDIINEYQTTVPTNDQSES